MVTTICMSRTRLITKQKMEELCKGKDKNCKNSINDDLETLIEDIQLGEEPDGIVDTYFLPKLTKEELQLVEKKDYNFMQTLSHTRTKEGNADVSKAEMEASESDSKYVAGWCRRATFTIENSYNQKASCSLQ